MPEKGGRPAIVGCEVIEIPGKPRKDRWQYVVGYVERVRRPTIEGARDRIALLTVATLEDRPCIFVDVGTPQGVALRATVRREDWPKKLHLPHAYPRTRGETGLFAHFLEAYADGRVHFLPGLASRAELDKALVLYRGSGTNKTTDELESEDEALVLALCLSLAWPTHGQKPNQETIL